MIINSLGSIRCLVSTEKQIPNISKILNFPIYGLTGNQLVTRITDRYIDRCVESYIDSHIDGYIDRLSPI